MRKVRTRFNSAVIHNLRFALRAGGLAAILGAACLVMTILLSLASEPSVVATGPTLGDHGERTSDAAELYRANDLSTGQGHPDSARFRANELHGTSPCGYAQSASSSARFSSVSCGKPSSSVRDYAGR